LGLAIKTGLILRPTFGIPEDGLNIETLLYNLFSGMTAIVPFDTIIKLAMLKQMLFFRKIVNAKKQRKRRRKRTG